MSPSSLMRLLAESSAGEFPVHLEPIWCWMRLNRHFMSALSDLKVILFTTATEAFNTSQFATRNV